MGSSFTATPEEIAAAAARVHLRRGEMSDEFNQIRSYILGLDAAWQGVASGQFQGVMDDFNNHALALMDVLERIGNGLSTTSSNVTDFETTNHNLITNVGSGLAGGKFR